VKETIERGGGGTVFSFLTSPTGFSRIMQRGQCLRGAQEEAAWWESMCPRSSLSGHIQMHTEALCTASVHWPKNEIESLQESAVFLSHARCLLR